MSDRRPEDAATAVTPLDGTQPVDPHTADELIGQWWLPDEPARKVPGTLRFPAEGPIDLDLMDLLADGNTDQRHPVVLGVTADGSLVTLEDLEWVAGYDRRTALLEHPMRRETFGVGVAFIGAHLPSESDRAFSDAVVDFTDLLPWSGPSGLSGDLGPSPADYSIQLVSPAPREARLPFGTVALSHGWKATGDGRRSHGIEKEVGFEAHMDAARNLESWLRMVIGPLRHLLTFATDRPNEVSRLAFKPHRDERMVGQRIAVRYARSPAAATTDVRPHEFLFDAGTLDDDFEQALVRWFGMIGDGSRFLRRHQAEPHRLLQLLLVLPAPRQVRIDDDVEQVIHEVESERAGSYRLLEVDVPATEARPFVVV